MRNLILAITIAITAPACIEDSFAQVPRTYEDFDREARRLHREAVESSRARDGHSLILYEGERFGIPPEGYQPYEPVWYDNEQPSRGGYYWDPAQDTFKPY